MKTNPAKFAFRGTELSATPKLQADGRLAIELVCKRFDPILYTGHGPQLRVHEISSSVQLAPGEVVVLDGAKQERVEAEMRGFFKSGLEIGQVIDHIRHIQKFVVVSREPLLDAAAPEVR